MKHLTTASVATGLLLYSVAITAALSAEEAALSTEKELSYAFGVIVGQQVAQSGFPVDAEAFLDAIRATLNRDKLQMTFAEAQSLLQQFQQKLTGTMSPAAMENKVAGEEFLSQNKNNLGVVTLDNGLQYKIIRAGSGPKPKPESTVKVHYRGTLINGVEFDSSYSRNMPATFPVKGVIQGWQKILVLMPTGSKWQVFIPSQLAYGAQGAGDSIGPNATLVFDIELLDII